jgi:hypothetical protein
MFTRRVHKGACSLVIAAAATAALSGSALAAEPADQPQQQPGSFSRPIYLDDAAATATPPPPPSLINEGLDKVGLGKTLSDAGIKVGGWVEGSYTWNFRNPRSEINEGRVFDFEHDAARLNQIELNISRTPDVAAAAKAGKWDWGFMVDMMYGSDGRLIHANGLDGYFSTSPINQFDLTQAYGELVLPFGNGLDLKFGKFVTFVGYETINPTTNPLYSHSFGFGFGIPFTHTGITAGYDIIPGKLTVTGGITRGWEQATNDSNGAIDFLGQVKYVLSDELNFLFVSSIGPQRPHNCSDYRYLFEGIGTWTPKAMSNWTFTLDGLFAWEEHALANGDVAYWGDITGYVGYKINDMFTINGRVEWFRDDGGSRIGVSGSFFEGTIGVTIHPCQHGLGRNFMIRPELRGDYSNKDAFAGGTHKSQATIAVDAIFAL